MVIAATKIMMYIVSIVNIITNHMNVTGIVTSGDGRLKKATPLVDNVRVGPVVTSPRLKHGPANNGPIQVKEHSPFSRTSTSPHSRVVAEVNSRVKSGTDSIGSFSPPLMASPPSPTSSFGNSLFDGQALQSRTLAASPSDVYVPELLHLPACQPATNHAATVPAVALNSHDAPQSSQKVEEEEDMVPMDLASSLSAHQSPAIDKEPTQRPSTPPLPPQQGEQPAMDTKGYVKLGLFASVHMNFLIDLAETSGLKTAQKGVVI
ncbi:unnamed protein product [Mesocestoides corti]|uniref:Uncharacterized protein n=1 Tax=Mesocestoides corti TaxID=53468 RepID=A0A0R3UID1_MESCO|nr:unnamed protein product [Mesocestoides corti]